MFSVHTDHAHLHAHIVFNSLSFVDGHKYHYRDGDWKKYVQPVTDAITVKYGLSPLTYEEKKKGVHYGLWMAKKGKADDLKEEIDRAIQEAASYGQFLRIMERKYHVRRGFSQKWQSEYLAFRNEQMPRGFRSYSLGKAYTVEAIKKRIELKEFRPEKQLMNYYVPPVRKWQTKIGGSWKRRNYLTLYQKKYMYYYWQVKKTEKKFSGNEVRKQSRQGEEMLRCLKYLIGEGIEGEDDLKEKRKQLRQMKEYYELQNHMAVQTSDQETEKILERYQYLKHYIETHDDVRVGTYENEMDDLEENYPIQQMEEEQTDTRQKQEEAKEKLRKIRSEQMIIRKIKREKGIVL